MQVLRILGVTLLCVGMLGAAAAAHTHQVRADVVAPAAAAADYPIVAGDQFSRTLMQFDPAESTWDRPSWTWTPTEELGFTARERAAFSNVSDFKLRGGAAADRFVVGASGGLVAIVDRPTGRKVWATTLPRANPHAVELLPDGNLAVAASAGGYVRVYASSQQTDTFAEFPLTHAHGALWDPTIQRLWVLGDVPSAPHVALLTALEVHGTPAHPKLREDQSRRRVLPTVYGHDLSPNYQDPGKLWVTTNAAVYLVDKASGEVTAEVDLGGVNRTLVKSIGNQPSGQLVLTRPDPPTLPGGNCGEEGDNWCTATVSLAGPGAAAGAARTVAAATFYKARVWSPYYVARDEPLRGTLRHRTGDPQGGWHNDADAVPGDADGRISSVAAAALPDGTLHVFTVVAGRCGSGC